MSDSSETITGSIKWFDPAKGYGFVQLPGGGVDVFIHANQLRKSGISRALVEGEKVRFVTGKGPKGSFATGISLVQTE